MTRHRPILGAALLSSVFFATTADPGSARTDVILEQVPFTLHFGEESSSLGIVSSFLLPGEWLEATAGMPGPGADDASYTLEADEGRVERRSERSWRWQAPEKPGLYSLLVRRSGSEAVPTSVMRLNAFVMIPAGDVRGGAINGYAIGDYPSRPLNDQPTYQNPKGFVEVTPELAGVRLSPHFTVGQFLCKQGGAFPKYVVLKERLILKLEHLLSRVNELGYPTDSFHVMSGFRTPSYNQAIGNVAYSRHVWGDAADIFIDSDGDGVMDDLNRDGRVDVRDAEILFDIVDHEERHRTPHFTGGLGKYRANAAHGPFVHVDARGTAARW